MSPAGAGVCTKLHHIIHMTDVSDVTTYDSVSTFVWVYVCGHGLQNC